MIYTEAAHMEGDGEFKSHMAADHNCGFNSLYIYCDAAKTVTVADTKAPLLRGVSGCGNNGDTNHRMYTTPLYVRIAKKEFHTV